MPPRVLLSPLQTRGRPLSTLGLSAGGPRPGRKRCLGPASTSADLGAGHAGVGCCSRQWPARHLCTVSGGPAGRRGRCHSGQWLHQTAVISSLPFHVSLPLSCKRFPGSPPDTRAFSAGCQTSSWRDPSPGGHQQHRHGRVRGRQRAKQAKCREAGAAGQTEARERCLFQFCTQAPRAPQAPLRPAGLPPRPPLHPFLPPGPTPPGSFLPQADLHFQRLLRKTVNKCRLVSSPPKAQEWGVQAVHLQFCGFAG